MLSFHAGSTHRSQGVSASIHSLPYELFAIIFHFCFLNHRFMGKFACASPCPDEAPLLLMRVCRKWREYAILTPSLWSRVSLGKRHREISSSLLNIKVNEWMDRAGSIPLYIDVYYQPYRGLSRRTAGDAALLDIFSLSRAWHSVSLEMDTGSRTPCIDFILDVVLKYSPTLQCFEFYFQGYHNIHPSYVTRVGWLLKPIEVGDSSHLTSLTVAQGHTHPFRLCLPTVKLLSIKHLHLQWPETIDHSLEILDHCPHVEVLHISIRPQLQAHTGTTSLTMQTLHTLRIYSTSDECVAKFIDGLRTPALTTFSMCTNSLCSSDSSSRSRWPHLSDLFARSQSPLTYCEFLRTPMLDDDIIKCLQHTPALTNLSGDEHLWTIKVTEAMMPSINPNIISLCPCVTTVVVHGIGGGFVNAATMISSRIQMEMDGKSIQIVAVDLVELGREDLDVFIRFEGLEEYVARGHDHFLQ